MKKTKITITEELSPAQIDEKYNVSRATAYRASKRGWLHPNYHGDQSGVPVKAGITQKFQRLVQHPAINIAQLASINRQKIHDVISGKSTLRIQIGMDGNSKSAKNLRKDRECQTLKADPARCSN